MGSENLARQQLIEQLNQATRQLSTWTVLYHSAIAAQLNLNITDHKCLDILNDRGPLTAGQLAEITGLTTGAVTGVIDRLEKAGYVHRGRTPEDRRRVIILPDSDKEGEKLGPLFAHLLQGYAPHQGNYQEDDLRLLLRFVQENTRLIQEEINWLRKHQPEPPS